MKTPERTADDIISQVKGTGNLTEDEVYYMSILVAKRVLENGPTYPVYKTQLFGVMPGGKIPDYYEQIGKWLYVKPKEFWKEVIRTLEEMV